MEARTQKGTASGAVAGHEGMLVKIEAGTKVEDAGEMIPQLIAKMFEVDATSDVTPRYNQLSFGEQLQHCTDFDVYADDSMVGHRKVIFAPVAVRASLRARARAVVVHAIDSLSRARTALRRASCDITPWRPVQIAAGDSLEAVPP